MSEMSKCFENGEQSGCTQKACDLGKALEETSVEPAKQVTTELCLITWS
ncbi:hypothetical protein EGR_10592 [Echinococcus granulosus]|uniref:Uncharacterized protein n=1 Tax=Echinococcus granulosus TaxID=6210 RepID=W6U0B6_ECHGR|nr:hypothetical protein EGR_10592 [Echinococcus granulosus]EUB54550.1 hypothetical protein EGR_10592 [Echinococcus granulosus]